MLKELNNEIMELLIKVKENSVLTETCKKYKDLIVEYQEALDTAQKEINELTLLADEVIELKKENERFKRTVENLKERKTTPRKRIDYLEKRDEKLSMLEEGGVSNWEWYWESLDGYSDDE